MKTRLLPHFRQIDRYFLGVLWFILLTCCNAGCIFPDSSNSDQSLVSEIDSQYLTFNRTPEWPSYSHIIEYLKTKPLEFQMKYYTEKSRQLQAAFIPPGETYPPSPFGILIRELIRYKQYSILEKLEHLERNRSRAHQIVIWAELQTITVDLECRKLLRNFYVAHKNEGHNEIRTEEDSLEISAGIFPESWNYLVSLALDRNREAELRYWAIQVLFSNADDEHLNALTPLVSDDTHVMIYNPDDLTGIPTIGKVVDEWIKIKRLNKDAVKASVDMPAGKRSDEP